MTFLRSLLAPACVMALLSALTPTRATGQQEETPVEIAVVSSVSDLLGVAAVELGEGVRVRLGMEASECRAGEGILVYCETDGFRVPRDWHYRTTTVGPVEIALVGSAGALYPEQRGHLGLEGPRAWGHSGRLLFVKELVATTPGRVDVVVRTGQRRAMIAKRALTVVDREVHSWMPLERCGDGTERPIRVRNRAAGRALPCWSGTAPIVIQESSATPLSNGETESAQECQKVGLDAALPKLLPVAVDSNLRLSQEGDVLVVTSNEPIGEGPGSFLTRYWVNGTPFRVAPLMRSFPGGGHEVGGHATKVARFHFELDVAQLGCTESDRVSVQLLYCPSGSEWVGRPSRLIEQCCGCYTRMSNAIDLVTK